MTKPYTPLLVVVTLLTGCGAPPLPPWECFQIDAVRYVSVQSVHPRISLVVGHRGQYAVRGIPSVQYGTSIKACKQVFHDYTKFAYWIDGQSLERVE